MRRARWLVSTIDRESEVDSKSGFGKREDEILALDAEDAVRVWEREFPRIAGRNVIRDVTKVAPVRVVERVCACGAIIPRARFPLTTCVVCATPVAPAVKERVIPEPMGPDDFSLGSVAFLPAEDVELSTLWDYWSVDRPHVPIPGVANAQDSVLGFLRGRVDPSGVDRQRENDRGPRDSGRRDFEAPTEDKALRSVRRKAMRAAESRALMEGDRNRYISGS